MSKKSNNTTGSVKPSSLFLSTIIAIAATSASALAQDNLQAPSATLASQSLKPAVRDPATERLLPSKAGRHDSIMPPLKDLIPNRLFIGQKVPRLLAPPAPEPGKDKLVPPPGEEMYYPVRMDGQPYVLNVDRTVNLTDALNRFYYDPRWRGEVWVPFDQISTIERATRLMSTWREYNEFSTFRILNKVNIFFERWSGFGP